MVIDKDTIKQFEADALKALKEVASKYNVKLEFGGGTYDSNKFTSQLKVEKISASGMTADTQKAYNEFSWFRNIYGKQFHSGRHIFKVVGYHYYKTYPIECTRDDGVTYNFKNSIVNEKEFW